MQVPLLSLDSSGLIFGPEEIGNRLLAYFFASNFSQSNSSQGSVKSLPWILQHWGSNQIELRGHIKSSLESLFKNYFNEVDFDVSFKQISENNDAHYAIVLSGTMASGGRAYSIDKMVTVTNKMLDTIQQVSASS